MSERYQFVSTDANLESKELAACDRTTLTAKSFVSKYVHYFGLLFRHPCKPASRDSSFMLPARKT